MSLASEQAPPGMARRQFGRILTKLHKESGRTIKAVAEEMGMSHTVINAMLKGRRPAKLQPAVVEMIARIYDATDEQLDTLKTLAAAAKAHEWWKPYGDILMRNFDIYLGLEETATGIVNYEAVVLPGLLQTEEYMRALFAANDQLTQGQRDRHIAVRLRRQDVLTRDPAPRTEFLIEEHVIRRMVGGRAVMAGQVRRLAELGTDPDVDIRMVPIGSEFPRGVQLGSFILLDYDNPEESVVYVESPPEGARYLESPEQVETYRKALPHIEGVAHSAADTRALLLKFAEELTR